MREKRRAGRPEKLRQSDGVSGETSQQLAEEYRVGEKTIRNDAEFAEAVDTLEAQVRQDIRQGVLKRQAQACTQAGGYLGEGRAAIVALRSCERGECMQERPMPQTNGGQIVRDNVAKRLAQLYGASERQIRRDAEFASAVDTVCAHFELARMVRDGGFGDADRAAMAHALHRRDKAQVHRLMAKPPPRPPLKREALRQTIGGVLDLVERGQWTEAQARLLQLWRQLADDGR